MSCNCFRKAMLLIVLACGVFAASTPAQAITINMAYPTQSSEPSWAYWHYDGNYMAPSEIHQAVLDNVTYAKNLWAGVFPQSKTLTWRVQFGTPSKASAIASTSINWSGGMPSSAVITIRDTNHWYIDRTPTTWTDVFSGIHQDVEYEINQGTGVGFYMPTSYYASGGTSIGATTGHTDFLDILLHEMGHAMGLSSQSTNFSNSFTAWQTGTQYDGAFIRINADRDHTQFSSSHAVMKAGSVVNQRRFPSAGDILAIQKAGGWGSISSYWMNPLGQNPIHAVPEPGTYLMLACGLAVLPLVRRARKS